MVIISGDLYHEYREEQLKSNKFWIDNYYPNKSSISKYLKKNKEDINNIIKNNEKEIKNYSSQYKKLYKE